MLGVVLHEGEDALYLIHGQNFGFSILTLNSDKKLQKSVKHNNKIELQCIDKSAIKKAPSSDGAFSNLLPMKLSPPFGMAARRSLLHRGTGRTVEGVMPLPSFPFKVFSTISVFFKFALFQPQDKGNHATKGNSRETMKISAARMMISMGRPTRRKSEKW